MADEPAAGTPAAPPAPSLDEAVAALWGEGAVVEDADPSSAADGAVEHMYKPSERVFGAVAGQLVARGWSVYPQTADEFRRPGRCDGQTIQWGELAQRKPTPDELSRWSAQCATLNVAAALGPGSGNAIVVDIDVSDPDFARRCVSLALEILGPTPFRRVGRAPKEALVYRQSPDDPVENVQRKFAGVDPDGNTVKTDDGIDVLTTGKSLTFVGKHWKTGLYFKWLDRSPLQHGPEEAPVVSSYRMAAWLEAVDALRRFHRGASMIASAVTWQWDGDKEIRVPRLRLAAGGTAWVEDDSGIVIDGREEYLKSLVYRFVTANVGVKPERLADQIAEQFLATAKSDGRWSPEAVRRSARAKVLHLVRKIEKGEVKVFVPREGEALPVARDLVRAPSRLNAAIGAGLDFLPPDALRRPFPGRVFKTPEPGAAELPIGGRPEDVARVPAGLRAAYAAFFADVYAVDGPRRRVHVVKAPTGAGKTTNAIFEIARDPRTYEDMPARDEGGGVKRNKDGSPVMERAPILFLLPTYANIDELRARAETLNLDPSLDDEAFRRQAADAGLLSEDDAAARIAELKAQAEARGLDTMVYKGKLAAGCRQEVKVKAAMAAGIGTAALCETEKFDKRTGEREVVRCPFHDGCPAIRQRDRIAYAHVVFLPQAFMSLNVPEELRHVRCVVADERVHHLFLHTATFHATSLIIPRREPRLSEREKAMPEDRRPDPMDMIMGRARVARVAMAALAKGKCPARAILDLPDERDPAKPSDGPKCVAMALRVCSNAIMATNQLDPEMTDDQVIELCRQPQGHEIRQEHRFWKIVQERIEQINHGTARGERDMRLQWLVENHANGARRELVRMSWRTQPNWADKPFLLLDASAAPEIIRKIWNDVEVVEHDVAAPLNVRTVGVVNRTWSNASILGHPTMDKAQRALCAQRLKEVRAALSTIASLYAHGRVVVGASIAVRRAVNTGWAGPENLDWCHYGALRGLDFAKHHAAAVSIGRMEVPIHTVDGLAAALAYDDPEPERPFDVDGTGETREGRALSLPMVPQAVRLRDGHVYHIPAPMYPTPWARLIQKQYREEELLQFLGRLRPVYREGEAPVWFALSTVIPAEVVVDDLIHLDDLFYGVKGGADGIAEAARRLGGVLEPRLVAQACPDLYESAEAVARFMRRAGFGKAEEGAEGDDGSVDRRGARGWISFRHRAKGERQWRHAYVMAGVDEPEARLRAALSAYACGESAVRRHPESACATDAFEIEPASQSKPRGRARGRKPDKIDLELGDRGARKDAEEDVAACVAERIAIQTIDGEVAEMTQHVDEADGTRRPLMPRRFVQGVEDDVMAKTALTVPELEAVESLSRLWAKTMASQDDRITAPVLQDRGDVYEQLGDVALDQATGLAGFEEIGFDDGGDGSGSGGGTRGDANPAIPW